MKQVFVIGNGPSALNRRLGEVIDTADVVVRINDFKTVGYEEYVGSKTDILFTCRLNEYLTNLSDFKEVIIFLLMNPLDGITIPEELLKSSNITRNIDWEEMRGINQYLNLRENCYPSTGLMCLLTMIKRYKRVYILGFDHFKDNNKHYYEEGSRLVPHRHDGESEERLVNLFTKLGLIIKI